MSLYENINKQKRAGTSRSKSKSTISDAAYKNMPKGFPKKMNYGGMATTGTPDKDKIMGAASMQQNPQKSLMDMNRSGSMVAPSMATGGKVAKMYSRGGGVRKVNY